MEEYTVQKIKKVVIVLVWVLIVAWACRFFYDKELSIGRELPMIMAAQSLDVNELSYIYEGDIDEIFGQNINKEVIENNISIYMYENTKKNDWGRVIIYDKATTSFKYLNKTKNGSKVSGEAAYDDKDKEYVNTNIRSGETSEGCKVILKIKSVDKVLYDVKDIPNSSNLKCSNYGPSDINNKFLTEVIHKLI